MFKRHLATSTSFQSNLDDMIAASRQLLKSGLTVPALIQIYCTLDAMAWLARPRMQEDVTRKDFINWVDRYFLPSTKLTCTALDLYAARCGIVHSYNPKSRLSRQKLAKEIFYSWGPFPTTPITAVIKNRGANAIALNIDILLDDLSKAIALFKKDIAKNNSLRKLVHGRASEYFLANIKLKREGQRITRV